MICRKCNNTGEFRPGNKSTCKNCLNEQLRLNYQRRKQNPEWVAKEYARSKSWHDNNYDTCQCGKRKKPKSKTCFDCYATPVECCIGCGAVRDGKLRFSGNKCYVCIAKYKRELRAAYPEMGVSKRNKWLFKTYGLTQTDFIEILRSQGNKCAVCNRDDWGHKGPMVDHDHRFTGRKSVRGITCASCNLAIGKLGDCYESVKRAAEYLRRYEAGTNTHQS